MCAVTKKICFVTGNFLPQIGGLAKSAHRVVTFLSEAGYKIHVVVPIEKKLLQNIVTETLQNGVVIHWIPINGSLLNNNGQDLSRFLIGLNAEQQFDLFHAYFFSLAYPCLHVAEQSGSPLLASIRGSDAYMWSAPNMQRLCKLVLKKITSLTTVNLHLSDILIQNGYQGKVTLIKNSIPVNYGQRWKISTCKKGSIGNSGSFRSAKMIPDLLNAFDTLKSNNQKKLILIGDFPDSNDKTHYNSIIKQLEINEIVELTGFVTPDKVSEILLELNVFVMTSATEGFPNSLLEAASLGVPIVTTAFNGIEDYITNGVHAMIVPVGDINAIAQNIEAIVNDDALAEKLSAGALQLASEHTPKIEKAAWLTIHDKVMNQKKLQIYE
jgi:glycosyltransferase involved in cell wall biosynthesis